MSDLNVYGRPLAHTGPGTGPSILGVNWAFASPAIIAVGLRMWFRRKAGHGLDDWLMVVATAMLIVYEALLTTAVIWGLGRQFVSVTLKDAIFPITFIWSLQLESRKKIGLTALFSGSLLAFLASLAKIIYSTLSIRGESGAANGDGAASGILWITSGIEQSLVIILGTAPALGPLARMQIFNNVSESFVNLITFGHRSRRSPVVQSMHHEELELGQPRRLTDDGEESGRGVLQFVDGTLTTIDAETAKYVKRTDDFAVMGKAGHGRLS
ncbi:putative integral membrane protein [Rosellinia necatrix]|uniref:Putative integral membrane protein n=1 Tax=Rosellinia necatrix TaxID=77044 RepID=A0A1S7UKG0_ROSNE|nr:putative integral membrane protein [Rosellinia necatrix]